MSGAFSRRSILRAMGTAALSSSVMPVYCPGLGVSPAVRAEDAGLKASATKLSEVPEDTDGGWRPEGPDTPKICLDIPSNHMDEVIMRRVKQIGVNYVACGGSPAIPWEESRMRSIMDTLKSAGLTLGNMMIGGFPNTLYGRPGRDEEIEKVRQSIRAAGRAGLPVIEYNFYAHRAVEGYYAETGRAGAGLTAFDYDRVKGLPPLANEGAHTPDEMWRNITYFLKAVVPVAEQSGVRLALHPNDPPAPVSRGSEQIMGSVDGWKHLIEIVPSKANGITFDCGVTREMGHDPVEVCRYFGTRDRINHVHFRNVRVQVPNEKYTEVFLDEGQVNMFAVMKELVRQKYPRLVYPEHPRGLDADRDLKDLGSSYPGGGAYVGFVYNVGYTRAMLQAALA
ncbi:MAG: mannonate dehydratase [Terriglobia bacterium]